MKVSIYIDNMSKLTIYFFFILMFAAFETLNAQNYYDDVDFVDYGPAPLPPAAPRRAGNNRSNFEIKIELF